MSIYSFAAAVDYNTLEEQKQRIKPVRRRRLHCPAGKLGRIKKMYKFAQTVFKSPIISDPTRSVIPRKTTLS